MNESIEGVVAQQARNRTECGGQDEGEDEESRVEWYAGSS